MQDRILIFWTIPIHQVDPVHEFEVVHDGLVALLHPVEQVAGGHVQEEAAVLVVHHWKRHSNINFGLILLRRSGKTMFRFFFQKKIVNFLQAKFCHKKSGNFILKKLLSRIFE